MRHQLRIYLQCALKIINSILTLVGVGMISYSLWMLKKWQNQQHHMQKIHELEAVTRPCGMLDSQKGLRLITGAMNLLVCFRGVMWAAVKFMAGLYLRFIYTLLTMGMVLCFIALLGHFAVETANGFSLSIYIFFVTLLLILQGGACFFILVNKKWEDYVPEDPTGRFYQLKKFVKENIIICKFIGVISIAVQGLTIILAFILQSLGPELNKDSQNNDRYLSKLNVQQSFLVRPPSLPNANHESKLPRVNIYSMEAQELGTEEDNSSFSQVDQSRIPFLNGIQAED